MTRTVLLDAHETKRRVLQNAVPFLGTALMLAGVAVIVARQATGTGVTAILLGAVLMAIAPRIVLSWHVVYKGHAVRFENNVLFGECLRLDGKRITKGVLGYRKTLQVVIRTGDGIGDRITAESEAGLTLFTVRIVAESP